MKMLMLRILFAGVFALSCVGATGNKISKLDFDTLINEKTVVKAHWRWETSGKRSEKMADCHIIQHNPDRKNNTVPGTVQVRWIEENVKSWIEESWITIYTDEEKKNFMGKEKFVINRNNEDNVFVRAYKMELVSESESGRTHRPNLSKAAQKENLEEDGGVAKARSDPEYVHSLIQKMVTHHDDSFFNGNWLVKGVAVRQHYKTHEDVFILFHAPHDFDDKKDEWYRARYSFGFNGIRRNSDVKSKSMIEGNIQKSYYKGPDDRIAVQNFPEFRKNASPLVFFPQGNGSDVTFEPVRELFLKRVKGLTAARFHQLMWPTTHDADPNERIFKKYRLLPIARGRTNCIGFAKHVAWMLGLHKVLIRNLGCEIRTKAREDFVIKNPDLLPLPKQRYLSTVGAPTFQPTEDNDWSWDPDGNASQPEL